MQKLGILLVAVAALMAGLYLSASLNQPTPEAVYLLAAARVSLSHPQTLQVKLY